MERYFVRNVSSYLTPLGHFDSMEKALDAICIQCLNDCVKEGVIFLDCEDEIIEDFNVDDNVIFGIVFPNVRAWETFQSIIRGECIAPENKEKFLDMLEHFVPDNNSIDYLLCTEVDKSTTKNYYWYEPDYETWHDFLAEARAIENTSNFLEGIIPKKS